MAQVRDYVRPVIERQGPIRVWIVDDTGFPKKDRHSVGVERQDCGKQDNCRAAVSLSLANEAESLPIADRLYLPQARADDPERRRKARVPPEVVFQTKPQIALGQIAAAKAHDLAPGVILADAGYGADGGFSAGLSALGLTSVVGVQPTLSVWRPGEGQRPPSHGAARVGRRPCCVATLTLPRFGGMFAGLGDYGSVLTVTTAAVRGEPLAMALLDGAIAPPRPGTAAAASRTRSRQPRHRRRSRPRLGLSQKPPGAAFGADATTDSRRRARRRCRPDRHRRSCHPSSAGG